MAETFAAKLDLVDWASIIANSGSLWDESVAAPKRARVFIPTTVGGIRHILAMESVLAAALTLRQVEVHILLCDAQMPGCFRVENADFPDPSTIFNEPPAQRQLCRDCYRLGEETFKPLGITVHLLSSWVTTEERALCRNRAREVPVSSIPGLEHEGVKVGEHAHAGALRYYARGDLAGEPMAEEVERQFLEGAFIAYHGVQRLLQRFDYETAVFHHGIYVPMGVIGALCRREGVRVVNWNPAYRRSSFIFSHGDTYHHTLMVEPLSTWRDMPWSENAEKRILNYLESRRVGTKDWIWFHEKPSEDFATYAKARGINPAKPTIGMLSNVVWDAQLHYPANVFGSLIEWAVETVKYFVSRPDLQLLLRVHPAELRGTARSRQPLIDEIMKAVPKLPSNIFIIPPEEQISTYAAMEFCNAVLIYGTKTGVELTSRGIPVVVAGEAWIRNKGLTLDASSRDEYFKILADLPREDRMPEAQITLARKYAFHFFMRRMIPMRMFKQHERIKPYAASVQSMEDLIPGKDPGLDTVCDGIMHQTPFVYTHEDDVGQSDLD